MLADPYKCRKNVAIDYHPHSRILENALRILRTLTNAATNNANVLQTPSANEANVSRMLAELFSFVTYMYSQAL